MLTHNGGQLVSDTGAIITASSGKQNKAELFRKEVALLEPTLYQAAIRWLEEELSLERVIWRGVELVANLSHRRFVGGEG